LWNKVIGMGQKEFSLYEIEQFIREAGAEKVTEDAVRDLEREIEKLASTLTRQAMTYAEHAGRKKLIRTADFALTRKQEGASYSTPASFRANPRMTNRASKSVK
jgi:histone H3/H4